MARVTADEALDAMERCLEKHPRFTLPVPLKACTRCNQHAALYKIDVEKYTRQPAFYCGVCGPRVSIFTLPLPADDVRQVAADLALLATGRHDLLGTMAPKVYEGDDG